MADVFISYGQTETELADKLTLAVENRGISVWHWTRDMRHSIPHPDQTFSQIDVAKCVLCFVSSETFRSDFVFPEILRAYARRKAFFVVLRGITYGELESTKPRWCQAFGFHPAFSWDDGAPELCVNRVTEELIASCAPRGTDDDTEFAERSPAGREADGDTAKIAQGAIARVLRGQKTGSTLTKWLKDTHDELTARIGILPEELRVPRIIDRLTEKVREDEEWEVRNSRAQQSPSERQLKEGGKETSDEEAGLGSALAMAMFHGVMEDNRRLHRVRRELLSDVAYLWAAKKDAGEILEHVKVMLCP